MKKLIMVFNKTVCKICKRLCSNIGAGSSIKGMCERCYENGGDNE